ncbi:MAG: hypothetical protein Q9214_003716, partial [Letrouitia sp. 1 TL-2023]
NDGTNHAHEEPLDKTKVNHALMANTQVYVAADYYQIPGLMHLAVNKFQKASMEFSQPGFADVVDFVFQSTTNQAQELRSILCSTFLKNAASLVSDKTFMDAGTGLSRLLKQTLPKVVANYEDKLKKKKTRIRNLRQQNTSLTAEIERSKAKTAEVEATLGAEIERSKAKTAGVEATLGAETERSRAKIAEVEAKLRASKAEAEEVRQKVWNHIGRLP